MEEMNMFSRSAVWMWQRDNDSEVDFSMFLDMYGTGSASW